MEHTFASTLSTHDALGPSRFVRHPRRGRIRVAVALAAATVAGAVMFGTVSGGASAGAQRVVVHQGDSLWSIAAAHYRGDDVQARVADIESANHLTTPVISPGETLILPAA